MIDAGSVQGQSVSVTATYIGYSNLTLSVDVPSEGSTELNFSLL